MNSTTHNTLTNRVNNWQAALEQELRELMLRAATVRAEITKAKTAAKREYYEKKFKKITPQVMQMLTALERVKTQQTALQAQPVIASE